MKNYRFTKQEHIVYDVLLQTKEHPTIKEVYNMVKNVDSKVGQATVYRNINKLVELGKVRKITTDPYNVRYDADISIHQHLYCNKCCRVYDVFDDNLINFNKYFKENYDFSVESVDVDIIGKCKDCRRNNEKI